MTREEFYEDCLQAEKEATTRLESVKVTVCFTGYKEYEFTDCTLEEAREMAVDAYSDDDLNDAEFTLEEVIL